MKRGFDLTRFYHSDATGFDMIPIPVALIHDVNSQQSTVNSQQSTVNSEFTIPMKTGFDMTND